MNSGVVHIITGAFGYSGKYIARRLLEKGCDVRTLTNSGSRENPFRGKVKAFPYNFDNPEKMVEAMRGASVFYNTYWVRFNHPGFTHKMAVQNTLKLFDTAQKAGVKRIVHFSITNPSLDSPLEYFRGKAILEKALMDTGISYAILRPAVIFGREDILINNIAWMLRRFPVFAIFGNGDYKLQPIFVEDIAELAVEQGSRAENCIINAIGPETFTYRELVLTISRIIGKSRPIISVPASIGYLFGYILGKILGDVTITKDEIEGLMADLLYVNAPAAGRTKFTDWAKENAETLGIRYHSELKRRRDRVQAYERL